MTLVRSIAGVSSNPPVRSRRRFLVPGVMAFLGVVLAMVWRRVSPPPAALVEGLVTAGSPADYGIDEVRVWPEGRFYMVRGGDGFVALFWQCPHLGCTIPPPRNGAFECLCHRSRFDLNGEKVFGPAQRAMDRFPIRLHQGKLVVQTTDESVIRRATHDPQDAFNPNSVA